MAINRVRAKPATIDNDGLGILEFDFGPYVKPEKPGIVTRMIAGLIIPLAQLTDIAKDEFTRVVASGWGTATSGQIWSLLAGGPNSVDGALGQMSNATPNVQSLPLGLLDFTIAATMNGAPSPAASINGLCGRVVDAANMIWCGRGASPVDTIYIGKRVAGVDTTIVSGVKAGAGTGGAKIRFTAEGSVLSAKFWETTDPEPANYDLSTGNAPTPVAGGVGVRTSGSFGSAWDDFSVATQTPTLPTWDAYINDYNDPTNLQDSSQGIALPRWVPALVNGQPIFINDRLFIIATNGSPGSQIFGSCHLVVED